jgi:hypothetical protein
LLFFALFALFCTLASFVFNIFYLHCKKRGSSKSSIQTASAALDSRRLQSRSTASNLLPQTASFERSFALFAQFCTLASFVFNIFYLHCKKAVRSVAPGQIV